MKDIKWPTKKEEMRTIEKIVDRAKNKYNEIDRLSLSMDIGACHANGNPLNLSELLEADDLNFFHDVFGIMKHLNRKTGKLEDFFSPRFSA